MVFGKGKENWMYGKRGKDCPNYERMQGRNNPNYGNLRTEVSNAQLHKWVRIYKAKPDKCQICEAKKPFDLANITGKYTRDLKNWIYVCRKCHMESDGRLINLRLYKRGVLS